MKYSIASAIAAAMATGTVTAGVTTARGATGKERGQSKFVHRPLKHAFFTDTSRATTTQATATIEAVTTDTATTTVAITSAATPITTETTTTTPTLPATTIAVGITKTNVTPSITTIIPTPTTSSETTKIIQYAPAESPLEKIPVDVLLYVALLLSSRQDFANLLQTCRYIYFSLDTHWVWHQRFLIRHGRGLLMALLNPRDVYTNVLLGGKAEEDEETSGCSKEDLTKWYCKFTRKSVPPKDMVIGHLDTGYWHLVSDPRSAFDDGLVANLGQGLSWLNVSGSLFGVPPGRYWVQWSYNLRNPTAVVGTQFRVATFSRDLVPVWHYETKSSIDYTPGTFRKFLHHTTATNKELLDPNEVFIFQLPQVLVVEENKPTVFVQMREHNTHKDGIMILFLRLVLAGDDEDDVKAEREDVEEEEEEEVDAEVARYEYEEVDNFSDQGEDGDNDGEYVDYGESDDDAENGDEGGHDGDGEPVAVDNGGYANGSSSTLSPNVDQDEDEDSNARPYFIRFAERNSHSGVSILDI